MKFEQIRRRDSVLALLFSEPASLTGAVDIQPRDCGIVREPDCSLKFLVAAESGVIVYAGSDIKTYGNLVLVRHDNGFVTAYAHASRLLVKSGDKVRRGQAIAKSGRTGSVTEPQLHFEIREGATPVDPAQYLPRG